MRKNTALVTFTDEEYADIALSYSGLIRREKGFKVDLYLQGDKLNQRNMFMAKHRVYVGFIPKNITEADFRETFLQYGKVTEAYIHKELKRYSHASDSISHFYGFVTFEDPGVVTMLLERKYVPIYEGTSYQKSFPNFRQIKLKESRTK